MQRTQAVQVGQLIWNLCRVKEGHDGQVLHHASVILSKQSHIERLTAVLDVVKAHLITQRGLAAARGSLDHIEAACEEAAAQNSIKTCDTGWDPFKSGAVVVTHEQFAF